MGVQIRSIAADEFVRWVSAFDLAFLASHSPEERQRWKREWEGEKQIERCLAAMEGGEIVGTSATQPFDLTLPGLRTIPAAGVTAVSVRPTHRRQGLLTRLMHRELDDAAARGEAVAILYASEVPIYGRFGFGPATLHSVYTVATDRPDFVALSPPAGELRIVDGATARKILPPVADRHAASQPGAIRRNAAWWDVWIEEGKPDEGMSERFYVTYTGPDGKVEGYAAYRSKGDWSRGWAHDAVTVNQLIAVTDRAYHAIWHYLIGLDLVGEVTAGNRPVDEPLRWLLADSRRLQTKNVSDGLWVRIVSVPAALESRRYAIPGTLRIAVHDRFRPQNSGTYLLESGPEGAHCRRDSGVPDIELESARLGSAYLGGVSFTELARAGHVTENTLGSLHRADLMFTSSVRPWCPTGF